MNNREFVGIIETFAPLSTQAEWDNSGWQIFCGERTVKKVLTALEITDSVADEAVEAGADLIVTHHPFFFSGYKRIDSEDITGRQAIRLIRAGISVYSTHTPFDLCKGGNNDYFGELMGFEDIMTLGDVTGSTGEEFTEGQRICRCGRLKEKRSIDEIAAEAARRLQVDEGFFSCVGPADLKVGKVCWCTGAGSGFMDEAARWKECGLYITGDLKYHEARHAADLGLAVLDLGHFATERLFPDALTNLIEASSSYKALQSLDKGEKISIIKSRIEINPFSLIVGEGKRL